MIKVLVFGLPGSGKTEFSKRLCARLDSAAHINADAVRKAANDWDFSPEGRARQAARMNIMAEESGARVAIMDFVCPKAAYREMIRADHSIWMNTIDKSRYEDTNAAFEKPLNQSAIEVTSFDYEAILDTLIQDMGEFDYRKPTAQMMGRYQPWHGGHRELFKESLRRVGQVCIMVRDTYRTSEKDPFTYEEVCVRIRADLIGYEGRYTIQRVPNVTDIYYGRDVGYAIERIELPPEVEDISATKIRMALL